MKLDLSSNSDATLGAGRKGRKSSGWPW